MKQPAVIFKPTMVAPDVSPDELTPNQAIAAKNMVLSKASPTAGQSRRIVWGNVNINNNLLPGPQFGTNKTIGWCSDLSKNRIFFANWNPQNQHAIYCYDPSQPSPFQKVLEGPALVDFTSTTKLSMDFDNGYLLWTSRDIEEPRQIYVERAIDTYLNTPNKPKYILPIEPWETYQIQRVPKVPLDAYNSSNQNAVKTYTPKPDPSVTDQGYQFAYNYEFINNIEGRLSPPTQVLWNQSTFQMIVDIPPSEVVYLTKGAVANPYIVAIRIYFRVGNRGDWVYFKRLLNIVNRYDFDIYDFSTLSAIGTPSIAALLGADGITRRVDDLLFADSRQVHSRLISGHTFDPPTATVAVQNIDNNFTRQFMTFAPLNSQTVETALVFFDEQDRIIGGKILPAQILNRTDQIYFNINRSDNYFATDKTFDDIWGNRGEFADYSLSGFDNQFADTYKNPALSITPNVVSGGLPTPISKVMLATKAQKGYSSFLRTQCYVFLIYSSPNGLTASTVASESFVIGGVVYSFYGIGFLMGSRQPINFSTEQNYHIQVRGITGRERVDSPIANWRNFFLKDFKITDQLGSILVSRQLTFDYLQQSYYAFSPNEGDGIVFLAANFSQTVADVLLYSKDISDKPWQLVPTVSWDRNQFINRDIRYYYGDAYITNEKQKIFQTFITLAVDDPLLPYFFNAFQGLLCVGVFASMNLNGTYQESWDSNVGNPVVIEENPQEKNLLSFTRHGEQYLLGTQINNIFAFNPLNEDHTPSQIGPITKVSLLGVNDNNGNNLYYVCEAGVEVIYLGKTQQLGTDGNSIISLSTRVFGSHNTMKLPYGTANKFNVTKTTNGLLFYVDERNNILVQISANGQDPISEQRNFESDISIIQGQSIIGFDPLLKEIVVAWEYGSINGLAYKFIEDSYQGYRTFGNRIKTELFGFLSTLQNPNKLYGWAKGELYEFNMPFSTTINGESFDASLSVIWNVSQNELKNGASVRYLSIAGKLWSAFIKNPTGRETDILIPEFEEFAGYYKGSIMRDINSVGGRENGDLLNGPWLQVDLISQDSRPKDIVFIEIGGNKSLEQ